MQQCVAHVPGDQECLRVVGAIHTPPRGEQVPEEWFCLGKAAGLRVSGGEIVLRTHAAVVLGRTAVQPRPQRVR